MDQDTVTWAALCEKMYGWLRKSLCAKHHKMNHTKTTSGQDPDKFLYIINSSRDQLNTSKPPEGPTDRQYEGIILQALSPDYESIRRVYLERRDGLQDRRKKVSKWTRDGQQAWAALCNYFMDFRERIWVRSITK